MGPTHRPQLGPLKYCAASSHSPQMWGNSLTFPSSPSSPSLCTDAHTHTHTHRHAIPEDSSGLDWWQEMDLVPGCVLWVSVTDLVPPLW